MSFVCLMVFNATFNNISVISWRSVVLVEETRGLGENHRHVASHWQTWSHNVFTSPWSRFELTTYVVIGTGYICSCKSNYHTIMATTAPNNHAFITYIKEICRFSFRWRGSMSLVVGSNSSYKPITNTAWFGAQLWKLQKRVHSTRSRKWYSLPRLRKRLSPLAIYSAITTNRGVLMCVSC